MADLKDLVAFAQDVVPVVKTLFPQATTNRAAPPTAPALEALRKLQKLTTESTVATQASNIEAAEAVTRVRGMVFEVFAEAASSRIALDQTDVNTLKVLFNALQNRAGQLLEQAAFASIPRLIRPADLDQIATTLEQAEADIKNRQQAKEVLDAVVKTVIVAAQIAVKVAAA